MVKRKWKEIFHSFDKRPTPSRCAILEVFEEGKRHLSAEEVYEQLRRKNKKVGIATVYRNLDLLSRMGILRRVNFGDGREHYELVQPSETHHHHLVCVNCGRVIDYSELMDEEREFLDRLEKELEKKHNFRIQSHQVYFYGLCKNCQ
ncbi:transcriptional repressor [Thermatribacter velox]|uniref:Transcriptional repressor n=1 Tax=Thermatribacter velox TaxID=3039681 RepID=A0ABZ2YAJ6_9BACT